MWYILIIITSAKCMSLWWQNDERVPHVDSPNTLLKTVLIMFIVWISHHLETCLYINHWRYQMQKQVSKDDTFLHLLLYLRAPFVSTVYLCSHAFSLMISNFGIMYTAWCLMLHSLFAAWLFLIFYNKSHNIKALSF